MQIYLWAMKKTLNSCLGYILYRLIGDYTTQCVSFFLKVYHEVIVIYLEKWIISNQGHLPMMITNYLPKKTFEKEDCHDYI